MAQITVLGTGYLGASHAAALAEMGHTVVGIDVDLERIRSLAAARAPFYEPGLDRVLARHLESGRLRFTTDLSAAAPADVHFVCVGTPQSRGGDAADLTQVRAAIEDLAPHLKPGALVVGKSTVPVGTAAQLADRLTELRPDDAIALAWNPEFLREGHAVADTLRPDRIVVGVRDEVDAKALGEVYRTQLDAGTPYLVMDYATAELVKVAANAFLATKVSFANVMADVCDAAGADVTALTEAMGYDERIGARFLGAGIGFGGGCLPKDIRAFMARGAELGVGRSLAFLREVDEVNMRRRQQVIRLAGELLERSPLGARIAVLGVAFKPESDDVRDSPALNIAAALHLQGAAVSVYDPRAMPNARRAFPTLTYVPDVVTALTGADLVLLLTEWDEFLGLDPDRAARMVRTPVILDGRNALEPDVWRHAGWRYRGIGVR